MSYANRGSIHIYLKQLDTSKTKTNFLYDYSNQYQHHDGAYEVDKMLGYSKTNASYDIYFRNIGLIPNYSGHVPGAKYKFGETFGNLSVDAKSYLRIPKF